MFHQLRKFLKSKGVLPASPAEVRRNELEHRRQLEELVDAIPSIVSIIGTDHHYETVNATYERWFNLRPREAIGRHVRDIIGEQQYQMVRPRLERTLAGEPSHFETYADYPGLGRRYVRATYLPRFDANHRVTGVFAHIADLTDRKEAEENLRQSERTLEQIFVQSPAFMAYLSAPDYRFERANQKYFELTGLGPEILGKPVLQVLPEAEGQGFIELLDRVVRSGEAFVGTEVAFTFRKSGSERQHFLDFVYQPINDNDGRVMGVIALGYDVTAKVLAHREVERAKLAVENERENFRNLFKQTPEMVCILRGPDHVFEFVNEAHVRALGFDATGMAVREAQPESVEVHGILDEVYRTGKTAELHEIPVTVTDRLRYFNLTYAARRDPNGVIDGVMILGVEVSDQVQNRSALQQAVRARDEFMSIASHELKTPLTSLQLQSQIRQRLVTRPGTLDQEKLAQMFEADARHIRRINRLIDDMFDVSRIESGKFVLNREPFDLCELTREMLQRFGPQLESAGCEVELVRCESVRGNWDRFRIEQVITNLLTNAMKYGAGKPITVDVGRAGGEAVISVQDRGIGIAPENHGRIFDRFERAVHANDVSGLGLGLYITKQIVDLHQGRISLVSRIGAGSTFSVGLPLHDLQPRPATV